MTLASRLRGDAPAPSMLVRVGLLLALLTLTACGFQLRGKADLPFETLYVEGMDYSAISRMAGFTSSVPAVLIT